jgi:hypothetical protein
VPAVRFSRDKRGYEHVYLIDTSGERGRSRVLYWFRTPPGVRVGRSPFDLETQRTLEAQYPGVRFDWPQIVAARIPPAAPVENWREKRRAERAVKRARATEAGEPSDSEESSDMDELGDSPAPHPQLEIKEAEPLSGQMTEAPDSPGEAQQTSAAHDPDAPVAMDAVQGPPETGAGGSGRPRRRRRGGRRGRKPGPGPEPGAPGAGNGGLDQTNSADESSKEE